MRSTAERINLHAAVERAVFCSGRYLFFAIFLCLSLVSCAKKEVLRRVELEPYKGPVTVDVLKRAVGFGDVRSIKALADVTISKKGKREGSLNGVFGYKAPGKIRINLFGPFGLTVTEILISGELLQLSVPAKNTLYEWNSPEVSFTGLMNNRFNYGMAEEGELYVLLAHKTDEQASEMTVKYFFDRTYLLNRQISFWKDGAEEIKAEFYAFNGRVPEQTRLSFSNGSSINVFLQEPEFDSEIPDEYFRAIEHGEKEIRPFQEVFKRFAPSR
jgi:outer membrane lipoprotein-sorting protein